MLRELWLVESVVAVEPVVVVTVVEAVALDDVEVPVDAVERVDDGVSVVSLRVL